ncbi:hypothetical protein NSQ61_16325 [Aeribacillus sp. FSL K6-1121]|uniref:hypothetical protein n=1 Tax=unclassified Aeribacillus TaxID=2640495 RepID=UPI0030FA04E7
MAYLNRYYWFLWVAQAVSSVGDSIASLFMGWIVYNMIGVFCKEKIQSFATKSAENYNLTWSLWGRDEKARKPAISRAGYA